MPRPRKYATPEEAKTAQREAIRRFLERNPGYNKRYYKAAPPRTLKGPPTKKGRRTDEERARDRERMKKIRSTKSLHNEPPAPFKPDEDRRQRYEEGPPLVRCRCGTWTTTPPCQQCRDMDTEEIHEIKKNKERTPTEEQRLIYGTTERLMTYFNRGEADLVTLIENYIPPPILDGRETEED